MTPAELDTILAQDDWLRRIARHLVRDADLADDLVQDAWVASLEAGRSGDSARPWLLGVLRNTGARLFRTASTQHDRALRAVEGAETEAPAADLVASALQLRETLAHELRALDEPFRTAVYLRYIEGLSLKQAAQRAGVARSTLSERVTRGLELLRLRMDRAHGGERHAWALPLSPLAKTSGFAALMLGSVVMTGTVKLTLSAAVIGGLLFIVPRLTSTESVAVEGVARTTNEQGEEQLALTTADAESLATVDAHEPARITGGNSAERSPVDTAPPDSSAAGARVVGHFLLPDGRPAAGAHWKLHGWVSNSEREREFGLPDEWTDLTGELDSNGALNVTVDPPGAYQFTLKVSLPEHVDASWRWTRIRASGVKDVGTVTLIRAGKISGRIIDDSGLPVTGQRLSVYADEDRDPNAAMGSGRTGARGRSGTDSATSRFEIDGMPPGRVKLSVQTRSLGRVDGPVADVVAGETVEVDIVLSGLRDAVSKIAVLTSHRPFSLVPGPGPDHIWLVAPNGSRRAAQEIENRVTGVGFEDVGPGSHRVLIDDPRFEEWSVDQVIGGDTVRAQLRGSAGVVLDVQDTSGASVAGYSVTLELHDAGLRTRAFVAHSGDQPLDGGRLDGLVPGDYVITVRGDAGLAVVAVDALSARESRTVQLELGEPDTIAGSVMRDDGSPVQGAKVRLVVPAGRDDSPGTVIFPKDSSVATRSLYRSEREHTRTDDLGRFTFEMPAEGRYLVIAGVLEQSSAETPVFSFVPGESIEDLELILPRGARMVGRVAAPPGIELTDWRVMPVRPDAPIMVQLKTERAHLLSDGSFDTGILPAGRVHLYLLRPGTGVGFGAEHVPAGGLLLEKLILEDGQDVERLYSFPGPLPSSVTFKLNVEGGESGTGAVQLFSDGTAAAVATTRGPLKGMGPTLIPPGQYTAVLSGKGWGYVVPEPLTIGENETREISLVAHVQPHRIRLMQAGRPLANRNLDLTKTDGPRRVVVMLLTDENGWIDVRVGPGRFALKLTPFAVEKTNGSAEVTLPLPEGVTEIELD